MRILFAVPVLSEKSTEDEREVLEQLESLQRAARELGHETEVVHISDDLHKISQNLMNNKPALVVNLVESMLGTGRFVSVFPNIVEHLKIPMTGCSSRAIALSNDKLLAKKWMRFANILTPDFVDEGQFRRLETWPFQKDGGILKLTHEHASITLDDDSVYLHRELFQHWHKRQCEKYALGEDFFLERFVEGEELNVALLAGEVIAIQRIDFSDFPQDKPRIVNYAAKWNPSSFEYHHTDARFDDIPEDWTSLAQDVALRVWNIFGLSGVARVDLRVDAKDSKEPKMYVIDVNANPSLAPTAGFQKGLRYRGLTELDLMKRLIEDAFHG